MKILVPIKRVIDPNVPVRINVDRDDVVRESVPHAMNPFDEVALAKAASMRTIENLASELVAVSIGPEKASETLRTALAMGADRALHIIIGETDHLVPFDIARILAQVFQDEQPQLVMMGKQAIDNDAGQTPALLAGLLDLPYLPDTTELHIEDHSIFTSFDLNGHHTRAKAPLPAIIGCELHLFEPRPISLPQMMKAKRKPIVSTSLEELGIKPSPGARTRTLTEPPARPPCRLFDNAFDLAEQLKTDGLLK